MCRWREFDWAEDVPIWTPLTLFAATTTCSPPVLGLERTKAVQASETAARATANEPALVKVHAWLQQGAEHHRAQLAKQSSPRTAPAAAPQPFPAAAAPSVASSSSAEAASLDRRAQLAKAAEARLATAAPAPSAAAAAPTAAATAPAAPRRPYAIVSPPPRVPRAACPPPRRRRSSRTLPTCRLGRGGAGSAPNACFGGHRARPGWRGSRSRSTSTNAAYTISSSRRGFKGACRALTTAAISLPMRCGMHRLSPGACSTRRMRWGIRG